MIDMPVAARELRFYFGEFLGELAAIWVDLSLKPHVPVGSGVVLGQVMVALRSPGPKGFASRDEVPIMTDIGWALDEALESDARTVSVGSATMDGTRVWFFYTTDPLQWETRVRAAMHQFPDYPCRLKTNPDSRWVVYLSQLYPSAVELLGIRDRDVCSQLQQRDDPLTVPRQLIHHACFVTEGGRDRFVSGVVDLGYTIESATERGESAMPFGVEFRRVDVPEPWQITDRVTATLFHLAADAGGAYDGWGSPVVQSDR